MLLAVAPGPFAGSPAAAADSVRIDCNGARYISRESRALARPASCVLLPAGASLAEGAHLARLRWNAWGSSSVRATGIERGFHAGLAVQATVRAYRVRPDACAKTGLRFYTRLQERTRYGSVTIALPACSARRIMLSQAQARTVAQERMRAAARRASDLVGGHGAAVNGLRCTMGLHAWFTCSARLYVRTSDGPAPCRNPAVVVARSRTDARFRDGENPCMPTSNAGTPDPPTP